MKVVALMVVVVWIEIAILMFLFIKLLDRYLPPLI
jgi:hypothetical protein